MKNDCISLSFSLPDDKEDKFIRLCEKALKLDKISLRQLASIMEHFSWAIPTIPFAQAHYRNLQRFYITESRRLSGNLDRMVSPPLSSKPDLEWGHLNLKSFNGKSMLPDEPDLVIFSDATLSGWGACCEEAPPGVLGRLRIKKNILAS